MSTPPTLLFQGDSITDAGRFKQDPVHLGSGYAMITGGLLQSAHPERPYQIYNRGISGNRTKDLLGRWGEDCLDLNPSFLSILIGINNTWRRYDKDDPTPVEQFDSELRKLIQRSLLEGGLDPHNVVLLEPFLLDSPSGTKNSWYEDLIPKQQAVRQAADDFKLHFIPLQALFNDAADRAPAEFWLPDGVHPSPAGHALIAKAWVQKMEPLLYA